MREIIMLAEKAIIGTNSSFGKISRNFKPPEDHISGKLDYDDYDAEKNEIKIKHRAKGIDRVASAQHRHEDVKK